MTITDRGLCNVCIIRACIAHWVVNRSHRSLLYGVPRGSVLDPALFILYTQPLSDSIERHSVLYHMFTDGTELYNSNPRSSTDSLFCNMQNCVSDVKRWTIHNRLQLNEDRTEALPCDPSKSSDLPDVLNTDQSHIPFCNRRSSEIQGTALGKCLQAWPVHIGPGLRV